MPRVEAENRIQTQIEKGKQLLQLPIGNEAELDKAQAEWKKWSDYNAELLKRVVDTDELVGAYYPGGGVISLRPRSLGERVREFYSDVQDRVTRLESILDRLELIPESPSLPQPTIPRRIESTESSNRVFVVHGHDEEAKQSVARCIEKLGLTALILHEQPNQGRTVIEKFEDYADVGFAVVLLTPDDVGASKSQKDNLRERARQNVIFELGFFIGVLGRHRVCALHKGDVEFPSDFSGILWVRMDSDDAWRFTLAREMKAAGLDVDLNKLVYMVG
jgi:predicted nucleotide-binding protein